MPYNYDKPIEIRDFRNGDWFWVERSVWANSLLTSSDKVVYGTLAFFSNRRTQSAYPSFKIIAEHSAISRRQAINSIRKLEKLGYISTEKGDWKRKFANTYTLLKTKSAKFAPVHKKRGTSAKNDANLVQNSTSNNKNITIINNNTDLNKINDGKRRLYKKLGWELREEDRVEVSK